MAELAVHKRKVSEVASWIKDFAHHGMVSFPVPAPPFLVALLCFVLSVVLDTGLIQKLLVLSGPAGSGKSTTIFSLAKEMGIQIIEWINPVDEAKLTTQTEGPSSFHLDTPSPELT
jgi:cell cycle checkpoint protein